MVALKNRPITPYIMAVYGMPLFTHKEGWFLEDGGV